MNIIKISHIVKKLLATNADCRDSDELLILKVWAEQNNKLRNKDYPFRNFAIDFKHKNYASTESIRRSRQKLQEEFPNLRGKSYKARQNEQSSVKKQLQAPELLGGGTP